MIVNGLRIYWEYFNYYSPIFNREIQKTTCYVLTEKGDYIASASASCSYKDQFEKEKGRKSSLKRALSSTKFSEYHFQNKYKSSETDKIYPFRIFRKQIWEAYRTMTKIPKWKKQEL
jgi:hypothetical protein